MDIFSLLNFWDLRILHFFNRAAGLSPFLDYFEELAFFCIEIVCSPVLSVSRTEVACQDRALESANALLS